MRYTPIESRVYQHNRDRFMKHMAPGSVAVFFSNDRQPKSGDQFFRYKQQSDLFYLTGIEQAGTTLILVSGAGDTGKKTILFLNQGTEHSKIWDGARLSVEQARQRSGIDIILWDDRFASTLGGLLRENERVYLDVCEDLNHEAKRHSNNFRQATVLKSEYPLHQFERSQPIMRSLRMIKSEEEISQIRKAIEITNQGFVNVLGALEDGQMEYQLEATLTGTFISSGAQGHAFAPIVASGASACILHYVENDKICKQGDLVLMDFGADYGNYAADISRTIPVSGRFSERQAAVYDAVLHIMKETKQLMVPGMTMSELNKEVGKMMTHALVDLQLLDRKVLEDDHQAYRKYFMHGVSHHLGLDVHDLSDREVPFKEGMVLTCEPGIYIPEEAIGVRLENDILIATTNPVDLSAEVPLEREEIEQLILG